MDSRPFLAPVRRVLKGVGKEISAADKRPARVSFVKIKDVTPTRNANGVRAITWSKIAMECAGAYWPAPEVSLWS